MAQQGFRNAVLKNCDIPSYAELKSDQIIRQTIIGQLTLDTLKDLPEKNKTYFSLCVFFMLDEKGSIIPEMTEVRSESKNVVDMVTKWVNNQPAYYPKDKDYKERRSIFLMNFTYILNESGDEYSIATPKELREKNIITNYIVYDREPLFDSSCENAINELECTKEKILSHIRKNYRVPDERRPLPIGLHTNLIIDSNGKISLEMLTGSSPDIYENEMKRVIRTLPIIQPAIIKGIAAYSRLEFNYVIR